MLDTTVYSGYLGDEGDEWPRRQSQHHRCTTTEPHLPHPVRWEGGPPGQTCGGLPTIPEPRDCRACNGKGTIEYYLFGIREKHCNGEDDFGDCDAGRKVFL